jgi:TRAP-type uncharacterized transport system substrate-binding protein
MKENDRFNIYDLNGERISYGNMTDSERFSLYNNNDGIYIAYGIFNSNENFSIYDLNGKRISYGIMNGTRDFNIYNLETERISYGSRE